MQNKQLAGFDCWAVVCQPLIKTITGSGLRELRDESRIVSETCYFYYHNMKLELSKDWGEGPYLHLQVDLSSREQAAQMLGCAYGTK